MRHRVALRWGVSWVGLAGLGFAYSCLWGLNRADEIWFFSLAKLTAEGHAPYLDFVFHVLPTSLYLTAAGILALGPHVFTLKAVMAAIFASTAVVTGKLVQVLGLQRPGPMLFLFLFLFSPPLPGAPYGPFAYLFLLASALASLRALGSPSWRPWWLAGCWAGLAAAGKYNVGLLAFAGVVVAGLATPSRRPLPRLAGAAAGFALALLLNLLPVWLTGSSREFFDQVAATKGFYLRSGFVLPLEGRLGQNLPRPVELTEAENTLRLGLRAGSFFSVPASWLALWWLWRKGRTPRHLLLAYGAFLAAGLAGAFPRFDSEHVLPVVPLAAVPLFLFAGEQRRGRWATPAVAVSACVAAGTILLPLVSLRSGIWQPARLPHLAGARMGTTEIQTVQSTLAFADRIPSHQNILFLGPYAAFYYLASGRPPPTKQLLPLVSELGITGQMGLIHQLERGEIHWVCLQSWSWRFRPALVEEFVTNHLAPIAKGGECSWWKNPQSFPGGHGGTCVLP